MFSSCQKNETVLTVGAVKDLQNYDEIFLRFRAVLNRYIRLLDVLKWMFKRLVNCLKQLRIFNCYGCLSCWDYVSEVSVEFNVSAVKGTISVVAVTAIVAV